MPKKSKYKKFELNKNALISIIKTWILIFGAFGYIIVLVDLSINRNNPLYVVIGAGIPFVIIASFAMNDNYLE